MAPAPLSAAAPPAGAKTSGIRTVFTGDVINGKKVVSSLNTDDLEPGRKHLLDRGQGDPARQAFHPHQWCPWR